MVKSSHFLNDNTSVAALEELLPRLYWASVAVVEAAGGQFIKWTGDGFLAWFEVPLHRNLAEQSSKVFHAAYFLTTLINITQLGVRNSPRFKVRHGICYEQDALLIKIGHIDHNSLDLIGRAVVLAFRLSGMQADFPGIATQKELINGKPRPIGYSWKKKRLTREDNLKYFKGEKFGANNIYVSVGKIRKLRTTHSLTRSIKHAISKFEDKDAIPADSFGGRLVPVMLSGPKWCREIMKEFGQQTSKMHQILHQALKHLQNGGQGT